MPASLPVPSKGALRALRHLALGTSCTVAVSAGLLTEDRRRRINTAREVHSNAKRLKAARQYHSAGAATVETFEEQAMRYRDDAFWLPSNVLRDTHAALHGDGPGTDTNIQDELSSRPPPRQLTLNHQLPAMKEMPSFKRIPGMPFQVSVPKASSAEATEFGNHKLKTPPVAPDSSIDILYLEEKTVKLLELVASLSNTEAIGSNEEVMQMAIELHKACKRQKRLDLADKIFDSILAHGPISELHFHSFSPGKTIARLIVPSEDGNIHPGNLENATSIFLTKFTNEPEVVSKRLFSLGAKLCSAATQLKLDKLIGPLFFRMESIRGDSPPQGVHHLITATKRMKQHKQVLHYFKTYYTQTSPGQTQFYRVCNEVMDSMLEIERPGLAEQVLVSASQMAKEHSLLIPVVVSLKLLRYDWTTYRDIERTQALFKRLEPLFSVMQTPQLNYTTFIQFCVQAHKEDLAEMYLNKMHQLYSNTKHDASVYLSFALSRAYREDWAGVLEGYKKAHKVCCNDVKLLSSQFSLVLSAYAKSHSLTEIEDYISMFTSEFGLKVNIQTMNCMVAIYANAKEMECIARWIDYALADGCMVNAGTLNIIFQNCHYRWNFSFDEVLRLFRLIRRRTGDSSNLLNSDSIAFLRQLALTTRNPQQAMARLSKYDRHAEARRGVYRAMSIALANREFAKTLGVYKRAQAKGVLLSEGHLKLAVRASVHFHEISETAAIVKEAQKQGIKVGIAINMVFAHQVNELIEERVSATRLTDLCHSTITALQDAGVEVPLSVVTHTASCLHRCGFDQAAIDLWSTMSSRLNISPSSFDLASITTLLNAYIGLHDPAGVRWVTHMLAANKLHPDKQFKYALKNARRKTTLLIESQPCSKQVYDFLESVLECLEYIKPVRVAAVAERRDVRVKTINIVKKAIAVQKARDQTVFQSISGPKIMTNRAASESLPLEADKWLSDTDEDEGEEKEKEEEDENKNENDERVWMVPGIDMPVARARALAV